MIWTLHWLNSWLTRIPACSSRSPRLRRCEALAVRHSLGVLTVCAALEDVAQGHAPDKPIGRVEDTTLLGSPEVTPEMDARKASYRRGCGQSPIAMYVGNLEHYQGIGLLLDGFRHALARVPSAHLVIVGGLQDDIERYRRRAEQLGISSRVHFLGPRPISDLDGLLRRADVLVSPRLKGLNTPMKIYSYLDSGTAVSRPVANPYPGTRRSYGLPRRARSRSTR